MERLTVGRFIEENRERLSLNLVAGEAGIDNEINSPEINRPGLALSGFVDLFTFNRVQLIGNTELLYMKNLPKKERTSAFDIICQFDLPCICFTNDTVPPEELKAMCENNAIPLIVSSLTTTQFIHLFTYYTEDIFAPTTYIHGTLMDVYGMGLLFRGRPGIGKSEVSLDLVERGHRLVSDDIVHVIRKARGVIVGTPNPMTTNLLEIRGVGIVDVQQMFGVRATRSQKRIEIEVHLVDWDPESTPDRTGLDEKVTSILDVEIPRVEIPIYPGKYIAIIVESIALNHLLKIQGYNAAQSLAKRQIDNILEKANRMRK